jgi:hypothetical protein
MSKEKDMLKVFSSMPAEFEKYNPELLLLTNFSADETRDEQKLFHSFNDEPAMIFHHGRGEFQFSWYSHGEPFRDNKPATIFVTKNAAYSTHDIDMHSHSYDGQPSSIVYSPLLKRFEFTWSNHGKLHRTENLPAIISSHGDEKNISTYAVDHLYYENGEMHRDDGLPAYIDKNRTEWVMYGSKHNPKGNAIAYSRGSVADSTRNWALYGIEMNKEIFDRILFYQKNAQVPLWAATLFILGVIDDTHISFFTTESGEWNTGIPIKWVFHVWNITDDVLNESIASKKDSLDIQFNKSFSRTNSQLENFIKIIQHDEDKLLKQKLAKEFINA